MRQSDLFDAPGLPGLSYETGVIAPGEEAAVLAGIEGVPLEPFRFQGWLGKRQTASFGWRYDFDDASFARTEPIPDFLLPVREKAALFSGLDAAELVQVLVTRYDPGAGIGWHRDRLVFEHVVGVSLGVAATMRFRRRTAGGFERHAVLLERGSAYHLSGEARHGWEHSIAEMEATRWSVTFRSLSGTG